MNTTGNEVNKPPFPKRLILHMLPLDTPAHNCLQPEYNDILLARGAWSGVGEDEGIAMSMAVVQTGDISVEGARSVC